VKLLFTRNELRRLVDPERFQRGRLLARTIVDLYEDEWSLVGTVIDEGKAHLAMLHHGTPRLSAECDCPDGGPPAFCEHSAAVGLCYLDEDTDVLLDPSHTGPVAIPPSFTVRVAGAGDLRAIIRVQGQSEAVESKPGSVSELQEETWVRMMRTPDLTVYLAEVEDEPVGTATLMVLPNVTYDCAPTAFVEAVVVVAGHRRRGIAAAILKRILADARAAGCNKVQLLSHKRHAADGAHRLYAALGFQPEAEGFRLYLRETPAAARATRAP
jgi:GNAT superfamily N-acetyltransferase